MKKEIPGWVFGAGIAAAVAIGGFFLFRAMSGPPEDPTPKLNVGTEVPDYMKGKVSPEMEKMMKEQAERYGSGTTVDPNQGGPPTAPPNAGPSGG